MSRFIGCDVHKKQVTVCILDEEGRVVARHRIACTRGALARFAERHLQREERLALEATTHTWAVVELIEPYVEKVVVSNPLQARAIAFAKVKTDRIDAPVRNSSAASGGQQRGWCGGVGPALPQPDLVIGGLV